MAKVIATIGGVALAPGVSKNRRWYKPEHVAAAVARAQERISAGEQPMVMLTHHQADDDSRAIAARLTGMSLDENGNARYTAAIADTPAGRDLAALTDTSDGQPAHLKGVSIRGFWLGTVRKVKGPDGEAVETSSGGIELDGLDFTKSPGVTGAQVDTFAWVKRSGQHETTERVLITESVTEARVSITEETGAPAVLTEAEQAMLPFADAPHVFENGMCATCTAVAEGGDAPGDGSKPFGNVVYADPGYQADKQKRYPVDTKAHVKAALAYLAQKSNAAKYSAQQLKRIKGRIMAAAKKFGVTVSAESAGWSFDEPAQVTEAVAEHMGDPSRAGSWSIRAGNGPVDICLSSYCMDPSDLDVILRAAADAACKALAALDPDMDGDVDVPGVGDGSDPDDDAPGESAPEPANPNPDPAAGPAAATTETEDPAMAETTTPAAGSTPAIDPKILAEAVAGALAEQETARKARKAEKREKAAKEAEAARKATEAAAAAAPVTETEDQRRARLGAIVDQQVAAAAAAEGLSAAKTDEQLVAEMLEEKLVPLRQARAESGGVQRKGLAPLESIADSPTAGKLLEAASNEDLSHMAAAAYGPRRR